MFTMAATFSSESGNPNLLKWFLSSFASILPFLSLSYWLNNILAFSNSLSDYINNCIFFPKIYENI